MTAVSGLSSGPIASARPLLSGCATAEVTADFVGRSAGHLSGEGQWCGMLEITVRIIAPAERRSEILDVLHSVKGPTEVTSGCRVCRIMQDADNEAVLTYNVRWDTREELEDHFRSERFRRLLPYIDMSVEVPEVEVIEVERIGGIEILVSALGPETRPGE
jgi:quinol monooxygenase YgiN